jgi:hypothetical protein
MENADVSLPYNICSETVSFLLYSQPFTNSTYFGLCHNATITLYQLQNIEMWKTVRRFKEVAVACFSYCILISV